MEVNSGGFILFSTRMYAHRRHLPQIMNNRHQQLCYTHLVFRLWLVFTFLVIAESESDGYPFSTDELLGTAEAYGTKTCSFPSHWIGNWFQSGVRRNITISHSSINIKGKCVEVEGEKYLVYEPLSKCHRCLVFNEKHTNVLQYKESFCFPERHSLSKLCSTITADKNLFAMFRLDAQPIECPLNNGPFTFSYDRGRGECSYPQSRIDSCTLTSRLLFNYQACPDVPKTESIEEEVQCLAAWRESNQRYFLGLIQYRHHGSSSYEDRFRCYAYEVINNGGGGSAPSNVRRGEFLLNSHHNSHHHHHQYPTVLALGRSRPKSYQGVTMMNSFNSTGGFATNNNGEIPQDSSLPSPEILYRVVQSGDATCDGLNSMEGSRTMFLRRAPERKKENCQFPSWVQTHTQWHSLDHFSTYQFDGERFKVMNFSGQVVRTTGADNLALSGTCMQLLEDVPGYYAKLILHSRSGCKIGYQCMVLHKRDNDILEVQLGEWSRKHEEACDSEAYFDPHRQPYKTLISSTPKRAQCPNAGEFSLRFSSGQEMEMRSHTIMDNFHETLCATNGSLRMGCTLLDSLQLEVSSQCHDHNHHQQKHSTPGYPQEQREVTDYNCHGWWEEDGITYMVATLSSASPKVRAKRHCFVIRDTSSSQWMRVKEGQEQMSPFRQHSNSAAGQHVGRNRGNEESYGNSRREMDETLTSSSSAALFFFNNNNNHAAVGRTLQISSFADSCRRNVIVGEEGDFAFNATKIGHCFASSSSPSAIIRGGYLEGKRQSIVLAMISGIVTFTQVIPRLRIHPQVCLLPVAIILLW